MLGVFVDSLLFRVVLAVLGFVVVRFLLFGWLVRWMIVALVHVVEVI